MEKFSVREVVEMAVKTEQVGYKFYTETAAKFKDNKGINDLFSMLAVQETRHEEIYKGLLGRIPSEELPGWEEAQNYFRAIVQSEFFLGSGKSLTIISKVNSVKEAVDFAIGFEKETALFFLGLKNAVKEKDLVDEIIQEEARHIQWLSKFRQGL